LLIVTGQTYVSVYFEFLNPQTTPLVAKKERQLTANTEKESCTRLQNGLNKTQAKVLLVGCNCDYKGGRTHINGPHVLFQPIESESYHDCSVLSCTSGFNPTSAPTYAPDDIRSAMIVTFMQVIYLSIFVRAVEALLNATFLEVSRMIPYPQPVISNVC
jgi:hypothetical protein